MYCAFEHEDYPDSEFKPIRGLLYRHLRQPPHNTDGTLAEQGPVIGPAIRVGADLFKPPSGDDK